MEKFFDKKACFFDFDGTVWFGRFSDKTLKALDKFHDDGNLIFINSGRSRGNMNQFDLTPLHPDGLLNGFNHITLFGKDVYRQDLPKEIIQRTIALTEKYGLLTFFEGVNSAYKKKGILPEYGGTGIDDISVLEDVEKYPITKLSVQKPKDENGNHVQFSEEILRQFREDYATVDFPHYLECLAKGSGKDKLINKVIDCLGLQRDNVYVFGDSMNDYDMLKTTEHSVAIAHAPDELKAIAEYVTESDFDGVAEALERYNLI